jgi:ATP-binding cassette subfamily B protein
LKLISHASTLDLQHFEDPFFYDKLDRSNGNYTKRLDLISGILNQFQNLSLIIFLSVSLININAWLILFIPALVLPNFFGDRYFSTKLYSLFHVQTSERRELYYYYQLGTSAHSAKEIKIFGLADFIFERLTRMYVGFYDSLKKLSTQSTIWSSVLTIIGTIGYYFIYAYIIAMTIKGEYSLGQLAFLTGLYRQLSSSMESFLGQFNSIIENSFHVQDFFDFFEIKTQIANVEKPLSVPIPIKNGFEFKNVSFKYYNSERFVLEDINLTIKTGEKIALVGENGAGKTTLVKLLARLYDPTKGEILLDGINLKQYDLIELRKHIGVIFQDYLKYEMSFSDNIAVGNIQNRFVNEKIVEAAERSQVDKLVAKYPDGYATLLGRTFHQGIELSGGEWQRIALARAYMCDAQLLILDEPTAALDSKSEYFILRRFSELSRNTAAVFISHRFSTARLADKIIVLDSGRIIEQGNHEQLLILNAKYAELFNLQAIGYK